MHILGKAKHKILTSLAQTPLHGYELSKKLDLPLTGIYQHLKELSEAGLIAAKSQGSRKRYQITPRGSSLLQIIDQNGQV